MIGQPPRTYEDLPFFHCGLQSAEGRCGYVSSYLASIDIRRVHRSPRLLHLNGNRAAKANYRTLQDRLLGRLLKTRDKEIRGQCRVVKQYYGLPTRACKTTDAAYHREIVQSA